MRFYQYVIATMLLAVVAYAEPDTCEDHKAPALVPLVEERTNLEARGRSGYASSILNHVFPLAKTLEKIC